ncbi:DUF3592 domain-containing protein [Kangiella shandongensis]|uniref:DUF3592 domain-containing protein n=1 Tax=Kangiella shandongensis TaxID=2763258 RepID=UPI001CBC0878|nr:DUF3592 domain-containing protein [Kangiella shandongensis]
MSNEMLATIIGLGIFIIVSVIFLRLVATAFKKPLEEFKGYAEKVPEMYRHWKRTSGVIKGVKVKEEVSRLGYDSVSTRTYTPCIEYSYEINGQTYTGNQLALVLYNQCTYKDAENFLANYQVGKPVIIHYDPDDHRLSSVFIKLTLPKYKKRRGPLYFP